MPVKAIVVVREESFVSLANRSLLGHALGCLAAGGVREAAIVVSAELAPEARAAVGDDAPRRMQLHWLDHRAALNAFVQGEPFVLHLADSLAKPGSNPLLGAGSVQAGEAVVIVHPCNGWAFSGVAILGPGATAAFASLDCAAGPEVDLIAKLLEGLTGRVRTRRVTEWWRHRSSAEALLEGNRFALEGLRPHFHEDSLLGSRIQGSVVIHPSARLESTIVRGPAVIGEQADLRDAYVGPYTSIGPGVTIEGAEIEHSIILAGASVRHLGGRLEASIVGAGAIVHRDFRLPKALRLNLGAGAEVSLA